MFYLKDPRIIFLLPIQLSLCFSAQASPVFIENPISQDAYSAAKEFSYPVSSPVKYIVNDITIILSSGVGMYIDENSTALAVAAGSEKGRYIFTGRSDTGAVYTCSPRLNEEQSPAALENLSNNLDITKVSACSSLSS